MNEYDWLFDDSFGESIIKEPLWTDKEGRKIALSEMPSRYIVNCMKLLNRTGGYSSTWYTIFEEELKRRKQQSIKTSFIL